VLYLTIILAMMTLAADDSASRPPADFIEFTSSPRADGVVDEARWILTFHYFAQELALPADGMPNVVVCKASKDMAKMLNIPKKERVKVDISDPTTGDAHPERMYFVWYVGVEHDDEFYISVVGSILAHHLDLPREVVYARVAAIRAKLGATVDVRTLKQQ
jgi:hypothetical protein